LKLQEILAIQNDTLQTTSRKLTDSEAVISYLKTTIRSLTKTVESLNQTIQQLCGQPEDVSTC
jgi:uncharacterized coiled-coil protein SlyX